MWGVCVHVCVCVCVCVFVHFLDLVQAEPKTFLSGVVTHVETSVLNFCCRS